MHFLPILAKGCLLLLLYKLFIIMRKQWSLRASLARLLGVTAAAPYPLAELTRPWLRDALAEGPELNRVELCVAVDYFVVRSLGCDRLMLVLE